jgi:hypothetical protein
MGLVAGHTGSPLWGIGPVPTNRPVTGRDRVRCVSPPLRYANGLFAGWNGNLRPDRTSGAGSGCGTAGIARRKGRPGGRRAGRRTGDRGVGARGSVRGAQARFDTRSRVGGPVATEPQWPRGKRVGGSLGTRHSAVTRKFSAGCAPIKARPPASLPRYAASDTGGFASVQAQRQACACHGACLDGFDQAFGTATCPQGSTGPAPSAGPPLATRVHGSLCRGGQGLWTLWTASETVAACLRRRAIITL